MPFNVSPRYLQKVATLESTNDPLATNPKSSAKGLYQFTDPVAGEYNLDNPYDPSASTAAFKKLTENNHIQLSRLLGREPTEAELYLAHQQGANGAAKLIKNPDKPAVTLVGEKQVINNGGNPSMTGAEFANKWTDKYNNDGFDPIAKVADSGQIKNDASSFGSDDEVVDFGSNDEAVAPQAARSLRVSDSNFDPDTGKLRTAVDNFSQGTMQGWGSDISDLFATSGAVLKDDPIGWLNGEVNDPALAEQIAGLRENSMKTLAAGREENPWTAGASQVGGALTGATGLSKLIPSGVATRAAAIAKAAPNITAGVVGGGSSVINSLGEAPDTGLKRFNNVGLHDLLGVGAGVAGYQLAKQGGGAINAVANRLAKPSAVNPISDYLGGAGGPSGGATPPVSDLSPIKVAGILDEEDAAKLATGRVLPMTAGERTQNVKIQRMEEIAKKSGSEPFQRAISQQQEAAYKPLTSILGENQQIDPIALSHRTQDEMMGAANILGDQYDQLGNRVNQAYNKATQGANGVAINASNINNDFMNKVSDMLTIENVRPGDIPKLDENLSELKDILNPADNVNTLSVKLDKLEAWKKRLNRTIGNTSEPADARIVKMVGRHYDDFLSNLADDAIVNGDTSAIDAFKNARSLASQKFRFYDSDKAIQKILDNRTLSGSQLINTVLGANKLSGKGDNGRIVETMLNLAGDKAPEMQNAMRRGIMAKILHDSLSATTDATTVGTAAERKLLDFGKMKKSLGALMQQRETFGALFDGAEQSYFKQMYKDIDQIASKQPGAVNNSSTGAYMADMVQGIAKLTNNALFAKMSLGGTHYLQKGLEAHAANMVTGKAEKGLGEFLAQAFNEIDAPAVFYGGVAGSSSVDPIGNLLFGGKNDSNSN